MYWDEPSKTCYVFHFHGGGWNSVYAFTLEEAKEKIQKEFGKHNPNMESIHVEGKNETECLAFLDR